MVPVRGALTRTQQLSELADSIKKGGIYSVRVADDEAGIEGSFWLCRVLKKPEQATSDILHCGGHFKAGAWLVDIKWLSFQKTNSSGGRVYKELSPKAAISVGCIIDIGAVCVSTDRNFRVLSQAEHARIASST